MSDRFSAGAICRLIDALLPSGYPVIGEVAKLLRIPQQSNPVIPANDGSWDVSAALEKLQAPHNRQAL